MLIGHLPSAHSTPDEVLDVIQHVAHIYTCIRVPHWFASYAPCRSNHHVTLTTLLDQQGQEPETIPISLLVSW